MNESQYIIILFNSPINIIMSVKIRSARSSKTCEKCSICLSSIRLRGSIDSCDHPFCFQCIQQWSKIENTCPICKRRFQEIKEGSPAKPTRAQCKHKKTKVAKVPNKNQEDRNYQMFLQGIQQGFIEEIPQEFVFLNQLIFEGIQEIDFGQDFNDDQTPINSSVS